MIVVAELLVDWLKHAFITKFNEIPADVYGGLFFLSSNFRK
jgi:hypothetical protein